MSTGEEKTQERELKKLEGEFGEGDITNAPALVAQPSQAALKVAGYAVAGVAMICGVMAAKRGSHWTLSDSEMGDLHIALARVAEKYISIDLESPLMGLAAVVAAIAVPRVMIELANKPVAEQVPEDGD